ncbi:unnamed protein product, partial [Ixodes persulcatus]
GLDVELYYVKEGRRNEYALGFVVPVPANVSELEFVWQGLGPVPLAYALDVQVAEGKGHGALARPSLDVEPTGTLPSAPRAFRVRLPCTGQASAEVPVRIVLNVSQVSLYSAMATRRDQYNSIYRHAGAVISRYGQTQGLYFAMTKIRVTSETLSSGSNHSTVFTAKLRAHEPWRRDVAAPSGPSVSASPRPLVVAAGCACAAVAAAALAATASWMGAKVLRVLFTLEGVNELVQGLLKHSGEHPRFGNLNSTSECFFFFFFFIAELLRASFPSFVSVDTQISTQPTGQLPRSMSERAATRQPVYRLPPSLIDGGTYVRFNGSRRRAGAVSRCSSPCPAAPALAERLAEIRVERHKVTLLETLHQGTFGQVHHGVLIEDWAEVGTEQNVIVKTVTCEASAAQTSLLVLEGMALAGMNHANVLAVVGAACDEPGPPLLLYPYMSGGSLKRFLRHADQIQVSPQPRRLAARTLLVLVTQDLVDMAIQVAEGLQYLHKRGFVHRDVGTRNCL